MLLLAFAVYVALNVTASVSGNHGVAALGLWVLISAVSWRSLREGRHGAWLLWAGVTLLLAGAWLLDAVAPLLDTLAVAINAGVGWLFARTLRPGAEPLVTAMARLVGGRAHIEEPGVRGYTRALTAAWAIIMWGQALVLALVWLALHVGAPLAPATGLVPWLQGYLRYGSYLVIPLVFLLEYPWRCYKLPHVQRPPFVDMARRVMANWQHVLHGDAP